MSIATNTYSNYHSGSSATLMGDLLKSQGSGKASAKSQEMKKLLNNLNKKSEPEENPYAANSVYKEQGYLDLTGKTEKSKDSDVKEKPRYNYKDVSNRIRRAKTSLSAGQAVIAAKRKVAEIKRRIAGGKEEAEELQLALTHARRVEMAARKKKHHLELEEMMEAVKKREDGENRAGEGRESSSVVNSEIDKRQEEVAGKEDAIFEERQQMAEELGEELEEQAAAQPAEQVTDTMSDEMMTELNAMIAEFGEEELQALEEEMEQLESLEVINPHMSDEDLAEWKLKHRNAENKALLKADMDYLKGMIKHTLAKAGSGLTGTGSAVGSGGITGVGTGISVQAFAVDVSVGSDSAVPVTDEPAVDVQI